MTAKQPRQPLGFWKTFLASLLGMLIAGFLLCVLFVAMLTASFASQFTDLDKRPVVKENSILYLPLNRTITDNGPQRKFNFNLDGVEDNGSHGLNQIISCIEHAKEDKNIKGIFLDLSTIQVGYASLEAIRNALLDFKKSKKFIVSYGEIYDQKAYYLATVADKISLFPTGLVQHTGLSTELMFFKGMIDKLGLDVSIIRGSGNKFKSAVEPFMYENMSEANRLQIMRIQEVVWQHVLKGISTERGISVNSLNAYADSGSVKNPKAALQYKLVDELVYRDQVIDDLKKRAGIKKEKKLRLVGISKYYRSFSDDESDNPLVEGTRNKNDKIAVIYATGDIIDGSGDENTIGSITLSKQIREARLDKSVKAIVLRVNSPGGSALASEVIWRETQLAKEAKPFIVSMGDVAASGGYYIACGADKIYAESTTITGSIGVFGILPHTERFFKENTGITFDRVKTNRYSDIGSTTRKMDEAEYKIIQEGVDEIYDQFTLRVATGRKLDHQLVKDSIGEGRVWMGVDALKLGLVDETGDLNDAIAEAVKRSKVKKYIIQNYPRHLDPFKELLQKLRNPEGDEENENEDGSSKTQLFSKTQYNSFMVQLKQVFGERYTQAFESALYLLNTQGVKARLPYFITQ